MTLGEIIFQFPNNIKIIIRQLEKLERKQIKANMAIQSYLQKYIYIYIYIYIIIISNIISGHDWEDFFQVD